MAQYTVYKVVFCINSEDCVENSAEFPSFDFAKAFVEGLAEIKFNGSCILQWAEIVEVSPLDDYLTEEWCMGSYYPHVKANGIYYFSWEWEKREEESEET